MIQINVLDVLKELGIEYKNAGPDNVKIKCINPDHHENNPSMFVHRETGMLYCFGCHCKGNLFTLLNKVGITNGESKQFLKRFLMGGTTEEEIYSYLDKFVKSREIVSGINFNVNIEIPENTPMVSNFYLENRGITKEEILEWKMASVLDKKYLGWVLIPIYQEGILRNYFMRSGYGSGKMFGAYPRNDILFGLDSAPDCNKTLYITEGIFDTIFFRRTKNQCVSALSNRLLPDQLKKLKRYKKICIVPDNDEMGEKLIESAYSLIHTNQVFVCKLPSNRKDAAVCSLEEMLESTYKEITINQYIMEKKYGITTS